MLSGKLIFSGKRMLTLLLAFCFGTLLACSTATAERKPNVLFIAIDDLRPQLSCYGKDFMHTPNFDDLAKRGVTFSRAYCMVPTCGASRASLMTGVRPNPTRFVSYTARADQEVPTATTLNTHFKQNGYTTISLGKIFHFANDNASGWSEPPWRSKLSDYHEPGVQQAAIAAHRRKYPARQKVRGLPYEAVDAADDQYRDYETATRAIGYLDRFAENDELFFLAVGFFKPHLPFCAPKKYWDLYDFDKIDLPKNSEPPPGAPQGAVHSSGELRAYSTIPPRGPVSRQQARELIHGYYACVSFIDAQLGRLLESLDKHGLSENTIVVLWGDHGWQLGEHGMWNKHSCFETSMHAPLMVAAPGVQGGTKTPALIEFIDVYPSLCDLAGINVPKTVQGTSFTSLLKNPTLPGKPIAVGRYRLGDTIRTDRYRYSEYRTRGGAGDLTGKMLYDHQVDPKETNNLSGSEDISDLASELSKVRSASRDQP